MVPYLFHFACKMLCIVLLFSCLLSSCFAHYNSDTLYPPGVPGRAANVKTVIDIIPPELDAAHGKDINLRLPPNVAPTVYQHSEDDDETNDNPDADEVGENRQNGHQAAEQVPIQEHYPTPSTRSSDTHNEPHGHEHGHGLHDIPTNAEQHAHIQMHMDVPIDTSKLTGEQMAFHYFMIHDADKSNSLDGLELIKFLIHYHEQENGLEPKVYRDDELIVTVDQVLENDDLDKDGYISYSEYKRAIEKGA